MPEIRIENLSKKYGDFYALKDFSTTIEAGKIAALVGHNGAGKSTFLRILTQIYQPTQGNILIDGEELKPFHRKLFGYLPEDKGLYPDVNLLDQLIYFGKIKGLSAKRAEREARSWLEKFNLSNHLKSKADKLSKGMQQKVQFIASIIHSPEIVVLDEPLSGLDPANAKVIDDYILDSKKEGRTLIFSTHRMEQAEGVCDNILMINKGEKVLDGKLQKIKQEHFDNSYFIQFEDYQETLKYLEKESGLEIIKKDLQNKSFKIKIKNVDINKLTQDLCKISKLQNLYQIQPTINQIFMKYVS